MSNEKYSTAIAGLASAAMDGAEMMIASLRKDRDDLSAELEVARKEIASLQERVQQLGQLARDVNSRRVTELEAQLAAVGAGGVEPLRKRECLHQITEPDHFRGATKMVAEAEHFEREWYLRGDALEAAPVEAQHSTACLYHYALSRLGLMDNTGLRVLFWDAHNRLSWDSKTDWYVTPDADKADCGQCNAARAAQGGNHD